MSIRQIFQINKNGVFIGTPPAATPSDEPGRLNFGEECIINNVFPMGTLYLSLSPENPETYFGGAWALYGTGRLLVGVNEDQTTALDATANSGSQNFVNTVRATGGSNTIGALAWPQHKHYLTWSNDYYTNEGTAYGRPRGSDYSGSNSYANQPIGGGGSHSNNMPHIKCYIWERKEDNYWSIEGNWDHWPIPD